MTDKDLNKDITTVEVDAAETPVEKVADASVVETVDGNADTATNKANRKRLIAIIAAVCVVVLVAAGLGGWMAWKRHELNVALTECDSAAATVKTVKAEYTKLVDGDAKTASEITVEQVKDGKTVETLAAAVKASAPETVTCPVKDKKAVQTATGKLNAQADWYKTHQAALSKAVKNVNSSKLDKTIDTATALLNDSDGKVQDNAVRDELGKAIEAKDEQAIAEATQKVNDSIAAKTKADEEAAAKAKAEAEAAAQAAAAAAQSYTSSNYGYSNSGSGSTGSGMSSGSSSGSSSSGSVKRPVSGGHGCGDSCPPASSDGLIHR